MVQINHIQLNSVPSGQQLWSNALVRKLAQSLFSRSRPCPPSRHCSLSHVRAHLAVTVISHVCARLAVTVISHVRAHLAVIVLSHVCAHLAVTVLS